MKAEKGSITENIVNIIENIKKKHINPKWGCQKYKNSSTQRNPARKN